MGKVWNGFEEDDKTGQSRRVEVSDAELAARKLAAEELAERDAAQNSAVVDQPADAAPKAPQTKSKKSK